MTRSLTANNDQLSQAARRTPARIGTRNCLGPGLGKRRAAIARKLVCSATIRMLMATIKNADVLITAGDRRLLVFIFVVWEI
jgi:hypothetical protein